MSFVKRQSFSCFIMRFMLFYPAPVQYHLLNTLPSAFAGVSSQIIDVSITNSCINKQGYSINTSGRFTSTVHTVIALGMNPT